MNKLFVAALKEETVGLNYFYHVGVGKINATYNLTKLIHEHKPSEVINYGTAGAINKGLSGIVECTKFYQRDMDVSALMNLKIGETPFDNINEIINDNEKVNLIKNRLKAKRISNPSKNIIDYIESH
mgnify:CR=1 FL=1